MIVNNAKIYNIVYYRLSLLEISMQNEFREKLLDPKRRAVIDAKYAIHNVGHKRWDIISKNIGDELELWTTLFEAGKNNFETNKKLQDNGVYCGEENYLVIRPELINAKIIYQKINDNKSGRKIKKKEMKEGSQKKADKIRQENLIKKIKQDLNGLLSSISAEPIIGGKTISFLSKFVEFQIVKMMVQCRNLITYFEKHKTDYKQKAASKYTLPADLENIQKLIDKHSKLVDELVVGYNKIINEKIKNPNISKTCLQDLIDWVDYAKHLINFQPIQVILTRPELVFKTSYDTMLEHKSISLYPSQKEILKFITTNDKYLALVHSMLASGKTSLLLPISGWIQANRKNGVKTKVIFCCPNEAVLLEVAHMVYGMAVSFAIVVHNIETNELEYKWSHFASKTNPDETAILYLCDIFVARILLEKRAEAAKCRRLYMEAYRRDPHNYPITSDRIPAVPDYLFIGDELTKDADIQSGFGDNHQFSITTELFVSLMKLAPPKVILMSATLPTANQLPEFYQKIMDMHPEMKIQSFSSSEAKIGCALISNAGELYAPHSGSSTVTEIKSILNIIKTNPFVGRFYNFEVLLQMVEIFRDNGLSVPDIAEMYNDPVKANQTNIQHTAYSMLETLIQLNSDEIVQKICKLKKQIGRGVDLSKIFTDDVERFSRGCLIFSGDPVSTARDVYRKNFDQFLNNDTERNIFQQIRLDNILTKYHREMELYNKAMKRLEDKADDGISKHNREENKKERPLYESWQAASKMRDSRPTWEFPNQLQICSPKHLETLKLTGISAIGGIIGPEDLPLDSCVSMDILTMLASGIGIYTTENPALDDTYLKSVLLLAKRGLIKTIFTDSSIAYGTNLAVSDIIIIDEPTKSMNGEPVESIVEKHSIKTVFQMLGRAGRGGNLSYEAKIYTTSAENNLINKIRLYTIGTLDEGTRDEIYNIRKAFQILW